MTFSVAGFTESSVLVLREVSRRPAMNGYSIPLVSSMGAPVLRGSRRRPRPLSAAVDDDAADVPACPEVLDRDVDAVERVRARHELVQLEPPGPVEVEVTQGVPRRV